jgi:hypothetical protein
VGRVTGGRTAYAHNIRRIGADHYRLSWSFDTKIAGSRLRWPRTITRDTDEAGALRFARKWGCSMPNPEIQRAEGSAGMQSSTGRKTQDD